MSAPAVITLGCRLNTAESARIEAMLARESDVVVVNTCAVTAAAVRESRKAVRRAGRGGAPVWVTGCAATIDSAQFHAMPEVARVVPNSAKLLDASWGGNGRGDAASDAAALSPSHSRAFIPVQNGCDHSCTFCIIPQGRGASTSRPAAEVIAEIAAVVDAGVAEVVLTGVDLTSYRPSLGALVRAILDACPDLARLRLSSLDGVEIDPLLLDLITGEPRVMPHVHLSLQSGDAMILKRMKRRHTPRQARELVERLKAARPEIAVGADLIAGFPTEDAAMHSENLAAVRDCEVVHGHIFPYSPRPGTPAARMPQVDPALLRERAAELRAAVEGQRSAWLASLIGTAQPVLAERDGTGHAPNFARFALPAGTEAGAILTMTATGIADGMLSGAAA